MSYFINLTSLPQCVCTCYCLIPHPDKRTPNLNDITLVWGYFSFSPSQLRVATPRRSSLLSAQGNNDDPRSKNILEICKPRKAGSGVYRPLPNETVFNDKTRRDCFGKNDFCWPGLSIGCRQRLRAEPCALKVSFSRKLSLKEQAAPQGGDLRQAATEFLDEED